MSGKYEPLTDLLRDVAARGQSAVDLDFDTIGDLVGGLPASADIRQWWANNSQPQALAWRAADFHVDTVSLDHRRVRFVAGRRGGTYADRGRRPAGAVRTTTGTVEREPPEVPERPAVGAPVDVRVHLQWRAAGEVTLDHQGRPAFGRLEAVPGLYRMDFIDASAEGRPRVYIGESDNLRRRLSTNYRNPGSSQQTSLRINRLLRDHLGRGGTVKLRIATDVDAEIDGVGALLDLTSKAARLLAENAALVSADHEGASDIENLG